MILEIGDKYPKVKKKLMVTKNPHIRYQLSNVFEFLKFDLELDISRQKNHVIKIKVV